MMFIEVSLLDAMRAGDIFIDEKWEKDGIVQISSNAYTCELPGVDMEERESELLEEFRDRLKQLGVDFF